jgi:serine/threonine-protein kinase HipA
MKKIERLIVKLNFSDQLIEVGELVQANRDIYFKYYDSFLTSGLNISPVKLPFNNEIHKGNNNLFDGLHGVFYDSLPDSWGRLLLDRRLIAKGINPKEIGALERLSMVGKNGMGALQYFPSVNEDIDDLKNIGIDDIYHESLEIISGKDSEMLDMLYALGGSSGGARPKVNVWVKNTNYAVTFRVDNDQEDDEPWIIKFPASADREDIAQIEYAYTLMARESGLEVAECKLFIGNSGKYYFGTKRFDRIGKEKLHLHSASGILNDDHRYSQMDYGHLMDCAFQLEKSVNAYERVLRLAAFNVYSHNRDDHSKNFSFLMNKKGDWRFSPVYDLTFSSSSHGHHNTLVAGESLNPGKKQLLELANIFGLKSGKQIIEEVKDATNNWLQFARASGVRKTSASLIDKTIQQLIKS